MDLREKKASDSNFLDFIDYADFKTIKNLLMQYDRLEQNAAKGNTAWHAVKIDLDIALEKAGLTDKQLYCIQQHLIYNITLKNIAEDLNMTEKNIKKHVDSGLIKILRYLGEK
jgi:DNA-binding MarR family transcriptional regulator